MVSESNASGTAYSFNSDSRYTEVDLLNPKSVGDLKAKLAEFVGARRVPASLAGYLSPEQAVKDYGLALKWLEQRGHAYISNGGFLLDRYDPIGNTGVLKAFRESSYPFESGYWTRALKMDYSRVDSVKLSDYTRGQDLRVSVAISQLSYPQNQASAATRAAVGLSLMVGDREIKAAAKMVKPGTWEALLPASSLDGLKPGIYALAVESSLGAGDSPGVGGTTFLKF
jgi:peptide/nickel transport system substrate-binding protein